MVSTWIFGGVFMSMLGSTFPATGSGDLPPELHALLAGEENIREVIAFPKTQSCVDPLTNAPLPVDEKQLRDLGLKITGD